MTNVMITFVPVIHVFATICYINCYALKALLIFLVWFPRFLAYGGQSETQLAVRGSQEKVSVAVCLLFISRSTMTHRHAALTHRPCQPPLVPQSSGSTCYE